MALGNKTLADLLGPITKQLDHAKVADKVDLPVWEFTPARVTDGVEGAALVDMFADEAQKVRVQVARCKADGLAACIAEIVANGEGGSIVCARDDRFEAAGVYSALDDVCVWDETKAQECIDAAYTAGYGITYASAGIAETGTVVQPTGDGCGRALSLLPLTHIAVVDAETIVPTMLEVMKGYEGHELPSQVCFISGPSATADIELVRVEGVHGPMYVNYVIVE